MTIDGNDKIVLKIEGDFARQLKQMKTTMGANSEMDVVRQGLSLLSYAMGHEIKIEDRRSKRTLVFDKFKDKDPIIE